MPSLDPNSSDLQRSLRALAEALPVAAGSSVEQRLLTHFRKRRSQQRLRRSLIVLAASLAIIAGSLITPWHPRIETRKVAPQDPTLGFIELPYAQSGVPLEQAVIVRVNIPVSELSMMGMPHPPSASRKNVRADLLIGQDGVARAVRLIQ